MYDPINPNTLVPGRVEREARVEQPESSDWGWTRWVGACGCACLMIVVFALGVAAIFYFEHHRIVIVPNHVN